MKKFGDSYLGREGHGKDERHADFDSANDVVSVDDDGWTYFYRDVPKDEWNIFKAWCENAFGERKVVLCVGNYPVAEILGEASSSFDAEFRCRYGDNLYNPNDI